MKKKSFFSVLLVFFFVVGLNAQEQFGSEDELKEKASSLFEANKLVEATPLYAQLLSNYPKDPEYNFKYGACLLASDPDKLKALKYLQFAISRTGTDPRANYYLGQAYHLNYNFAKAVKQYGAFKRKASSKQVGDIDVDRLIEMCKNGNQLLSKLNEVQVIEKQEIAKKDFFRIYKLEGINGKIIAKPQDFQSKYDEKNNVKSVIYLPNNAKEVYYSSYGKKGENGKDIYKALRLGNGEWSEGVSIGASINTPYDEDYPFIHPDGRTLFFASKGHSSMGGYDLFRSVYDETTNQWGKPENLDFAFNSTNDDILFVTDLGQRVAYFASNRNNSADKLTVYKVLVDRAPAELSVIEGKFIADNNPDLKKATVKVIDKATNETVGLYETDKNGKYTIEIPKNGGQFEFFIETTPDAPIHTNVVTIPRQDEFAVLEQELRLVKDGDKETLVIKNIFDSKLASSSGSSGPKVSSEMLRRKANLEINFTAGQLAQLDQESKTAENNSTTTNDNSSSTKDEGSSGTADVGTNGTNDGGGAQLREKFQNNSEQYHSNIKKQQGLTNEVYNQSIELQKEAEKQMGLGSGGENAAESESAKQLALKSAFGLELANEMERTLSEVEEQRKSFARDSTDLQNLIDNNQLAEAQQKAKELETFNKLLNAKANVQKIVENRLNQTSNESESARQELTDVKERIGSYTTELETKNKEISDLKNSIASATSDEEKEKLGSQLDELELDVNDLQFQKQRQEERQLELEENLAALSLKGETLTAMQQEVKSSADKPIESLATVSETEKEQLVEAIKGYREKDQLAYSGNIPSSTGNSGTGNVPPTNSTDDQTAVASNVSTTGSDPSANSKNLTEINERFSSEMNKVEQGNNSVLKTTQKMELYGIWQEELENAMMTKEAELSASNDPDEQSTLQTEIDQIQQKIDQLSTTQASLADVTAVPVNENTGTADNETPSSGSETASEPIDPLPSIPASSTGGDNVVDFSSNVSEVDDNSIIDDSFSNLTYDQDYDFGNLRPSQSLTFAKKTLFEAGKLSKQAEIARQSAYTLPTEEERIAAFEQANKLEKLSEEKQLEAAGYFAKYNGQEYDLNRQRIDNANQYGEEFESEDLDLANLLSEEAEVFFNNASGIRAQIDPTNRLTRKEVDLQKAYDLEMLALQKQRQALTKLALVDDAAIQQTTIEDQDKPEFVQAITNEEVLSVKSAEVASVRSDSLLAEADSIQVQLATIKSGVDGSIVAKEKDSLSALYDSLTNKMEQNKNLAAVYYERKKQIEEGIDLAQESKPKASTIIRPKRPTYEASVVLDTVNIDDERKQTVLTSNAFVEYVRSKAKQQNLIKEADVEYQLAVDLETENERLIKQAIIEENRIQLETDDSVKQRLIVSAQVINVKVQQNKQKLDSLNRRIKIKNFMISQSSQQSKQMLAALSEIEKKEFVSLSSSEQADSMLAVFMEEELAGRQPVTEENQITSQESSGAINEVSTLPTENNTALTIPVEGADGQIAEETGTPTNTNPEQRNETENTVSPEEEKTVAEIPNEPIAEENNDVTSTTNTAIPDDTPDQGSDNQAAKPAANIGLEKIDEVPREIRQAIFLTVNKNESVYNENKPIPIKTKLPEGLVFKVQVGAFRNPIPQNLFKGFAPIMAEKTASGITRYTAGLFVDEGTAIAARDKIRSIGYSDAFVVAFLNGERISVTQARGSGGAALAGGNNNTVPSGEVGESLTGGTGTDVALSNAFNNENVESVVNAKTIDKLYFTVQIGVYSKPVEKGLFPYKDINVIELPSGLIRYNAGIFDNALDAGELKIEAIQDIPDAFITAYNKGKRISLNDAARLKNKN